MPLAVKELKITEIYVRNILYNMNIVGIEYKINKERLKPHTLKYHILGCQVGTTGISGTHVMPTTPIHSSPHIMMQLFVGSKRLTSSPSSSTESTSLTRASTSTGISRRVFPLAEGKDDPSSTAAILEESLAIQENIN